MKFSIVYLLHSTAHDSHVYMGFELLVMLTECVKFFCCTSINFCEQTHVSNKYNRTDVKKNDLSIMHRFSHTLLVAVIIVSKINNTCFRYIKNKNRFKFLLVVLATIWTVFMINNFFLFNSLLHHIHCVYTITRKKV